MISRPADSPRLSRSSTSFAGLAASLAALALLSCPNAALSANWTWDGSNGSWGQYWQIGTNLYTNHWGDVDDWFMLDWPTYDPANGREDNVYIGAGTVSVQYQSDFGPRMLNLTLDSQLIMAPGGGGGLLWAYGALTNNGSIAVEGGNLGAASLQNNGTILVRPAVPGGSPTFRANTLAGPGVVTLDSAGGAAVLRELVTHAAGHTIHGAGYIYAGPNFQNYGIISADAAGGALYVFPGYGNNYSNHATFQAAGGAWLQLRGTLDNTGGVIRADDGFVSLYADPNWSTTIIGGTLTSTGGGYFTASNGAAVSGITLSPGTQFNVPGNVALGLSGQIVNDGTISVAENGNLNLGTTSFSGNGVIAIAGALLNGPGGPTVTLGAGQTLRGYGTFTAPWNGTVLLDNQGTVEADGGAIWFGQSPAQVSGGTLTGGTWIARTGSSLAINGTPGITTNQGAIVLEGAGSSFASINALANNQGSFAIRGGRDFATAGALTNSGAIFVGNGSTLTVNGNYTQNGGGTLDIDGALTIIGGSMAASGGTLGGSGTIHGSVDLADGILAPGSSPGTLTIDGDLALEGTNVYAWQVASPTLADKVIVQGNLVVEGQMMVDLYGVGGLTSTDFELFHYDGTLSDSAAWTIRNPDGKLAWTGLSFRDNGVWLSGVHSVPEPGTFVLLALGAACALAVRLRKRK